MKKIFYSWQSDVRPARNKIKAALELAAKRLGDQLEEADRPEIDSDTKGTFGSEDIIETIFSKIDKCAIFVADVTPIVATERKIIPNPNVMTEVGYAIKAKIKNTRLYIYCTEKPIDENIMPFDIRGKSLFGFSMSDTPSQVADKLVPMLTGMLKDATPQGALQFDLQSGSEGWANWGGPGQGSGFRYHIGIDNFDGSTDYINDIKVVASNDINDPWATTHYKFDDLEANQKLKIEAGEVKDVWVFLTDQPGQMQRLLPDIDHDMAKLVITMRSDGRQIGLPIPPGRLAHR